MCLLSPTQEIDMSIKMSAEQLSYWQTLLAPFYKSELGEVPARGGKKTLTYIDKRALSNRLDSVCGPHGWFIEYEATTRGYKFRLHILVPTGNGTWVFMHIVQRALRGSPGARVRLPGLADYEHPDHHRVQVPDLPQAPGRRLRRGGGDRGLGPDLRQARLRAERGLEMPDWRRVLHTYFSLPPFPPPCPSGLIWSIWDTWREDGKGSWLKHKEVRILADGALVTAPPSIHVDTGLPYAFEGHANPNVVRIPALAPQWLLDMPRLVAPRFTPDPPKPAYVPKPVVASGEFYTRDEVIQAVGDRKLQEAKSWGLKTRVDQPNPSGWVSCWVPGREDPSRSTPSGSFHYLDGTLQDRKDGSTISFLDLGVALGRYATWQDCRDDLGNRYIGRRSKETSCKYKYGGGISALEN